MIDILSPRSANSKAVIASELLIMAQQWFLQSRVVSATAVLSALAELRVRGVSEAASASAKGLLDASKTLEALALVGFVRPHAHFQADVETAIGAAILKIASESPAFEEAIDVGARAGLALYPQMVTQLNLN